MSANSGVRNLNISLLSANKICYTPVTLLTNNDYLIL